MKTGVRKSCHFIRSKICVKRFLKRNLKVALVGHAICRRFKMMFPVFELNRAKLLSREKEISENPRSLGASSCCNP